MKQLFIFEEHTADIKIKLFGATLNELFEHAVLAFASYTLSEAHIGLKRKKKIEIKGDDYNSLMYKFFDELIYLLDAEHFLAAKAQVYFKDNTIRAELFGDSSFHYEIKQIKAATYAEMYVKKTGKLWEARVVLDV